MLNFSSILLFSEKPKQLADFYKKVFVKDPDMSDGNYFTFGAGNSGITIGPHEKIRGKSSNPERILINFETADVEREFKRIQELGAKVVAEPYHPMEDSDTQIATFADPDGNYFQLVSPWNTASN